MSSQSSGLTKKLITNTNDFFTFNFLNSITLKIIIVISISLLISAPISEKINSILNEANLVNNSIASYINTIINLLVVNIILLLFMNVLVLKPLKKHIKVIFEMSSGNFLVKDEVKGKDEFSKLGIATNTTIDRLSKLTEDIKKRSKKVSNISTVLEGTFKEINQAADNVSTSMQSIAEGSEEQNNLVIQAVSDLEKHNSLIQTVFEKTNVVNDMSKEVSLNADNGVKMIDVSKSKMNSIVVKNSQVSDAINDLKKDSDSIGEITGVINNISEQTNLLALNAAIEAARAGEYGKGFAVVAEEIRKLAESSKHSTDEINVLINSIQDKIDKTVENVGKNISVIDEGKESIQNTESVLNKISASIDNTLKHIEEINELTTKEIRSSNDIMELIEPISEISKNSLIATQSVAASTEEQTATIEDTLKYAVNLSSISDDLDKMLNQFKSKEID